MVEAIVEGILEGVIGGVVRCLGWLIIKGLSGGRASVKFEDGSVLIAGIAGWALILFLAYRLWLA